ncbi:MAG: ParB/RepB/Spo0J family partition protein [Fibrobacteria bacterium]|nr:ParB/RepB/Spo0J family partition protein [Fibrobacteria bacterium]
METNNIIMISPLKLSLSLAHLRHCPDKAIKEMVSSLERRGQLNPVIAVREKKEIILVDGFKRQRAALIIGMETLLVRVLPLHGAQMKAYVYLLNQERGFSLIEECALIHELVQKDGFRQIEVADLLQRHKSWVSRRLEIYRNLEAQVMEDIQVGLLPAGSARLLARLPEGNQVELAAAIQRDRLKVTQIQRLVDLWFKAGTPEARRFLITSSKKALALSTNAAGTSRRISPNAGSFFLALESFQKSALVLKKKARQPLGAMNPESVTMLKQLFKQSKKDAEEAVIYLNELLFSKEEVANEQT